ncbi:MAG: methionyl-tRNA formyltransferase [Candidatus Omnitrophica bacterium]|nr:methionyl-tRNA formyltransferase [Candidatus Omnitrophota bacterium]
MKIVFWAKGERGRSCLEAFNKAGYRAELLVLHPEEQGRTGALLGFAHKLGIPTVFPEDPNSVEFRQRLKGVQADLFVLAGYGKILKDAVLQIPGCMSINLHGGKLPQYRGSSPLNWTLINGEKSFSLSVIKVDGGVDTGDLLLERTYEILPEYTIVNLHEIANRDFPHMLLEVLKKISEGTLVAQTQDEQQAGYYPLRFPDDGLIIWDLFTAEQVHNRIRALTEPYPCATTYFDGRKVRLLTAALQAPSFFGEPGRIYRKTSRGLLICAKDKSLWIEKALFEDGSNLFDAVKRYDSLITMRGAIAAGFTLGVTR